MVQPEQKSSDVRVAAQVAEVLRGHEGDSRKELASHRAKEFFKCYGVCSDTGQKLRGELR
jgi:hypothetical protein